MLKKIVLLLIPFTLLFSGSNYKDVVHLKDGSQIQGIIIETIPNESIKIKSGDNIFVYQMDEIEKITKVEVENTNKNGDGTEDWYFSFGLGPSLTNNMSDLGISDDEISSTGIDISFYWHYNPKSIIGIGVTGKYDSYSELYGSIQYNLYNYSINSIHYIDKFGQGSFWRADIGAAKANIQVSSFGYMSDTVDSDWGLGISAGGGYSFDFSGKRRLLLGLYYTMLQIEGESESYLNFMINGLW